MIHILTVHWQADSWVDIQMGYFRRNIHHPYRVYAFLNGFSLEEQRAHKHKYFYSSSEPVAEHAVKLNLLADMAALGASSDKELLMFIDGDAFPVADVVSFWEEKSKQYPLVAVQRKENGGDIQPHPCFCITTIAFWKQISGDWKKGHAWRNAQGQEVADVGGNVLKVLNERGLDWYPLLRSNRRNLHPILFGLYGDLVYHHGAAFRTARTRADDFGTVGQRYWHAFLSKLPIPRKLRRAFDPRDKRVRHNEVLSQAIYESIKDHPSFYTYFMQPGDSGANEVVGMDSFLAFLAAGH